MSFEQFVFYVFAAVSLFGGFMMITVGNTVKAALYLVMTFISTAAIWIMLEAEFLGIVLVLVYVGAVMVLFIFVVMMLDINHDPLREGFTQYLPTGIIVALVVVAEMSIVLGGQYFGIAYSEAPSKLAIGESNTQALGVSLYTDYVYAVELAAALLLVAIVAAIVLTLRRRASSEVKYQNIAEQVKVQAKDRMRIVQVATDVSRKQTRSKQKEEGDE